MSELDELVTRARLAREAYNRRNDELQLYKANVSEAVNEYFRAEKALKDFVEGQIGVEISTD